MRALLYLAIRNTGFLIQVNSWMVFGEIIVFGKKIFFGENMVLGAFFFGKYGFFVENMFFFLLKRWFLVKKSRIRETPTLCHYI